MKKQRDLGHIGLMYVASFVGGALASLLCEGIMAKLFVFDVAATIVIFGFSVACRNSSVYDAYWSLTPMVMSLWLFCAEKAFSGWAILVLLAFNLWSVRLTLNWVSVFTDFSYEDWRYRKYRNETPRLLWPVVNFWGIHMMPTLVVFAGMLPLFEIVKAELNAMVLPGVAVMLAGVALEFFADRQMHAFLASQEVKNCCRRGLWAYSRHPNYLGEITVWLGLYLTMLPFAIGQWAYGAGFVAVAVLFNAVSIPLMEKRQLSRRKDYEEYRRHTSRLLLLPVRK